MSAVLELLEQEAQRRQDEAQKADVARRVANSEFAQLAQAGIKDFCGVGIWRELERYAILKIWQDKEGASYAATLAVDAPPLELAPFDIHYNRQRRASGQLTTYGELCNVLYERIGALLIAAHDAHPAHRAKLDAERQAKIDKLIRAYDADRDITPEHDQLMQLDPALATQLLIARGRRLDEESKRRDLGAAALASYEAEYRQYWQARAQIVAYNEAVAERYRAELGGSFEVTEIQYGLILEDATPGLIVASERVNTLGQDESGAWLVIRHLGAVEPWCYTHLAAQRTYTAPVTEDWHLCGYITVGNVIEHGIQVEIPTRPGLDTVALSRQATGELQKLPAEPAPSDELQALIAWEAIKAARRKIQAQS
jgi:hypothetical protein